MKLMIDTEGRAGFDSWFVENQAKQIQKALAGVGIDFEIEDAGFKFKAVPVLKRKETYEPIPNSPKNIAIMLLNADLEDTEILKKLGVTRESAYIITPRIRTLQGEYIKWQKIDGTKNWKSEEARIQAFAGWFEKKHKGIIEVGDTVYDKKADEFVKVIGYDKATKKFKVEDKKGFQSDCDKNELRLKI